MKICFCQVSRRYLRKKGTKSRLALRLFRAAFELWNFARFSHLGAWYQKIVSTRFPTWGCGSKKPRQIIVLHTFHRVFHTSVGFPHVLLLKWTGFPFLEKTCVSTANSPTRHPFLSLSRPVLPTLTIFPFAPVDGRATK